MKLGPTRLAYWCLAVIMGLTLQATQLQAWQEDEPDADDLFRQAVEQMQQEKYDDAAGLFEQVVKLDKENGRAWQLLGYSLHSDGKLDAAIKAHKKTASFPQFRGIAYYNLGCAYSLKKDADESMGFLNKAVEEGFDQLSYYETDEDLSFVRKDDRFTSLIRKLKGEDEPSIEAKKLAGTWKYTSGKRAGVDVELARLAGDVKITDKTFTIPAGGPDDKFVMKYKLDASKKPATIDLEIESGPVSDGQAEGIIKLEKNKITICYGPLGQSRPEKFESTEENGYFMFTLERNEEKKEDKDE